MGEKLTQTQLKEVVGDLKFSASVTQQWANNPDGRSLTRGKSQELVKQDALFLEQLAKQVKVSGEIENPFILPSSDIINFVCLNQEKENE